MHRIFHSFRTALPISSLLLTVAGTAHANTYSGPVNKADWADNVPSYIDMYIAVPDNMPESPPIIVNIHACGNNAGGQWSYAGFEALRTAIDSVGYIMIIPQQTRNCWNVGATESLTHGGGGDTGAIVQMVQYVIETYNADPTRVYAMGGSGGGMAVQALLAVYPEVFKAGHARAGVPAGCWAEGYADGDQWSGACAGGTVDKTPQQWGDYVRAINPDYTGPRPRLQINQGDQDATISYNNTREAIDEWTNVLSLTTEPTRSDSNFAGAAANYDRRFWDDACGYTVFEAWTALGQGHSMGYESVHILEWFGLDEVREQDPWDEQCGGMSMGGAGGAGAGGAGGAGVSAAGMSAGGMGTAGVGMGGTSMGGMGTVVAPTAGTGMGGMASATAGAPTSTGAGMTSTGAGMTSTGVAATAGAAGTITGAPMGSAGTASAGAGAPAGVVTGSTLPPATGSGCSVVNERVGGRATGGAVVTFVLVALGLVLGRRRHTHST